MGKHNLNFDTQNTLAHVKVAGGGFDVFELGLTCTFNVTFVEFHGFGTLGTKFTRNNDFATFGAGFHDESKNTIACTAYS